MNRILGYLLTASLTLATSYSYCATKIDGPNTGLSFGTKITQDEIDTYTSWYNTYKQENDIYQLTSSKWSDNRTGKWAWGGSYLMRSLLNMHRMTGQTCNDSSTLGFMEEFKDHADFIFSRTEISRSSGVENDYIQGQALNAWAETTTTADGSTAYVSNLVQTMMIVEPIAEAANYILSHPTLGSQTVCGSTTETYADIAQGWVGNVLLTLDDFVLLDSKSLGPQDNDVKTRWVSNGKKINSNTIDYYDEGWIFRYPDKGSFEDLIDLFSNADIKRGEEIAFNRAFVAAVVMGNTLKSLAVYDTNEYNNRKGFYEELIGNLLESWDDEKSVSGSKIKWHYAEPDYSSKWEDGGHGGIDVQALVKLFSMGYHSNESSQIIDENLLEKISYTFSTVMYEGDGMIHEFVNGSGNCDADTKKMGRWLVLNQYNNEIDITPFKAVKKMFKEGYSNGADTGFGYTEYLYVRGGCQGSSLSECEGYTNYPNQYKAPSSFSYSSYTPLDQSTAAPESCSN